MIVKNVELWFEDKNLTVPRKQFLKLIEEYGELVKFVIKNDIDEIKDAIGDMQVVIIGLGRMTKTKVTMFVESTGTNGDIDYWLFALHDSLNTLSYDIYHGLDLDFEGVLLDLDNIAKLYDTTPKECLELAYDVIKDRKGKTENGVFTKEKTS